MTIPNNTFASNKTFDDITIPNDVATHGDDIISDDVTIHGDDTISADVTIHGDDIISADVTIHGDDTISTDVTIHGDDIIPDDVIVREMTEDDVEEAAVIEGKTFSMPWKASDFLEMVKAPYAYYFVAEIPQRKIVGIIGLRDIAGEGEISNVAVDESYRRLGIGRKLMDAVIDKCDELKINDITLEVRVSNVPAIRLYESYGFVSEGIRPNFYEHPTEDAAIYWKRK